MSCGGSFEEAPPTLPLYLDLLPSKSMEEIFGESQKPRPALLPPTTAEILAIADQVGKTPVADQITQVNALLERARRNYEKPDWCNLLHDIQDALGTGAAPATLAGYIRWRVEHADWFTVQDAYDRYGQTKDQSGTDRAKDLEKRTEEASPELKPMWLYLRGALGFQAKDRTECAKWFARVWKEYPQSPRAESALFMEARCLLGQPRKDWYDSVPAGATEEDRKRVSAAIDAENAALDTKAKELFDEYLKRYPKGDYVGDVYGWLGAVDFRKGERPEALLNYMKQLSLPEHPELVGPALFMCRRILEGSDEEEVFRVAAQNPIVAMGTTYLVLHSPEPQSRTDKQTAEAKKWRAEVLSKLAKAVAENESRYQAGEWPPRYLALLAFSASASGDQKSALKICAMAKGDQAYCDDLLLAKATALQRNDETEKAIATYRDLLARYPKSPLADGVRVKLGLALVDQHQAGLALLELRQLAKKPEPQDGETAPPIDQSTLALAATGNAEVDQIIDALLIFAPQNELKEVLRDQKVDPGTKAKVTEVLIERYLAEEDFAAALPLITDEARRAKVANLAELTKTAKAAKSGANRAIVMKKLGDAWAKERGNLVGDAKEKESCVFADEADQADLRRRINGAALGYAQVDEHLESRDELRHAADWWQRAAEAGDSSPTAIRARQLALEAVPKIADGSMYAFQRAVETEAADWSRKTYEELQAKAPGSREAREAAYWNFTGEPFPDDSGNYPRLNRTLEYRTREAIGRMGYENLDYGAFGPTKDYVELDDYGWDKATRDDFLQRIAKLKEDRDNHTAAQLAQEVSDLQRDFHKQLQRPANVEISNLLDDLTLFLKEPNLSQATLSTYLALRLRYNGLYFPPENFYYGLTNHKEDGIAELEESADLKGVSDYVDFMKGAPVGRERIEIPTSHLGPKGEPITFPTRDYAAMEKSMREFLAQYPKSSKREAAALLLARAVHWQITPSPLENDNRFLINRREKFSAKRALEPLDAYDREFPNGRYAAEIRDWRASALYQMGDWSGALALTIQNLEDSSHPDLQPDAALRLANIYSALEDAENRPGLLKAIRENPKAVEYLKKYLERVPGESTHPLRYISQYLADTLGFTLSKDGSAPTGDVIQ